MFSTESYRAVRDGAAWVHRADRAVVRAAGADAAAWLQGLLTNDVETLTPVDPAQGLAGEARYAAYLTPQGRMITDARVVRLPNHILLDVPAALAASLVERFDGLIFAENVQVENRTGAIEVVELHGPRAPEMLAEASRAGALPGGTTVVRDDQFFVPGYAFYVGAADRADLESRLGSAGAAFVDLETLEVVRIESARPAFLVDMDADTIPLEAGIEDRAISFTKGCYVGQEIIVRVTQRGGGRVARKLVGLEMVKNGLVPARGSVIRAGDRDIGRITSAAVSPSLGRPIALGYVHRDFVEPGTNVTVLGEAGPHDALVARTPFVGR